MRSRPRSNSTSSTRRSSVSKPWGCVRALIHAANSAGMACVREDPHRGAPRSPPLRPRAATDLAPDRGQARDVASRARGSGEERCAAGTPVSYGGRFVAATETRIATINAGYADGIPRTNLMREKGALRHGSTALPVAGTVCMDLTMLDATGAPGSNRAMRSRSSGRRLPLGTSRSGRGQTRGRSSRPWARACPRRHTHGSETD